MKADFIHQELSQYPIVRNLPVAQFYYQGNHTHPVRRTVLVIKNTKKMIVGYEIREGNTIRAYDEVGKHIKSYKKDKIAKYGDYCRLRMSKENKNKMAQESTLKRKSFKTVLIGEI